ncbi:MAG: response regulator [Dokdonella sp.]
MPSVSMPRVLVSDDNPLSLQFFHAALTALGVDCIEAGDGAVALELAQRDAFDLMLLDVRMPGLDGPEVLMQIRAQPGPSRHAAALATTADNDAASHAMLHAAGFLEVLIKPLPVDALRTALDRHLPARHSFEIAGNQGDWLDENVALAAAGGDRTIATALRGLLIAELGLLPAELAAVSVRCDAQALRERLHRLDASAGFCGAPVLAKAGSDLRVALDTPTWPAHAIVRFLEICERTRVMLAQAASTGIGNRPAP